MTRQELEAAVRAALARLNCPEPGFRFASYLVIDDAPILAGEGPDFLWRGGVPGDPAEPRAVDADEALYLTLELLTRRIVRDHEAAARARHPSSPLRRMLGLSPRRTVEDDYSRRTWMEAQARLMGALQPHWEARLRREQAALLKRYPLTPEERRNAKQLDLSGFGLPGRG